MRLLFAQGIAYGCSANLCMLIAKPDFRFPFGGLGLAFGTDARGLRVGLSRSSSKRGAGWRAKRILLVEVSQHQPQPFWYQLWQTHGRWCTLPGMVC